jgi:hypothetical protein
MGVAVLQRQVVEMLEVLIGNDNDMAQVIGPPSCRDECADTAVMDDNVLLIAYRVRAAASQGTKRA